MIAADENNDRPIGPDGQGKPPRPRADARRFAGTGQYPQGLIIGLDVGSTTVKAVVVDPVTDEILWKDYQRHETKQQEKALAFLRAVEQAFPDVPRSAFRLSLTGTGGSSLTRHVGGHFVQEVNALSQAVERFYPEVQSVIELGGQDAKIIIFRYDPHTKRKKKIPSMNDKCAGGTGAVVDKISAKLRVPPDQLCDMPYDGVRLHPMATALVRVVEVGATPSRVFPRDPSAPPARVGAELRSSGTVQIDNTQRRQLQEQLAATLGDNIAKLFYRHERPYLLESEGQ